MKRTLSLAITFAIACTARADHDIVIYGGSAAGVAAAVQAARMGKSAIIIEPGTHLGGLTSGGLGWTDTGNKAVIGGIAREFYQRLHKYYDTGQCLDLRQTGRLQTLPQGRRRVVGVRAEGGRGRCLRELLIGSEEWKWSSSERLERKSRRDFSLNGRITADHYGERPRLTRGKMFVDATYEGDLMAAANVTFAVRPRGELAIRRNAQWPRGEMADTRPPLHAQGLALPQARRPGHQDYCRASCRSSKPTAAADATACRPTATACACRLDPE